MWKSNKCEIFDAAIPQWAKCTVRKHYWLRNLMITTSQTRCEKRWIFLIRPARVNNYHDFHYRFLLICILLYSYQILPSSKFTFCTELILKRNKSVDLRERRAAKQWRHHYNDERLGIKLQTSTNLKKQVKTNRKRMNRETTNEDLRRLHSYDGSML